MSSIRNIAKLSGVSIGTVYNVLNNPEKVKRTKREKVVEVIKQLNYEMPIPSSKKLTRTLGLVISNINNPLYPPVVKGVEEVLDQHGYSLILCNTEKNLKKEINYIQMLEEREVDGVVIMSASELSNYHHIYKLKENGVPIVIINRSTEDPTISQIMIDTFRGGYNATMHLIQLQHTRIAFFSDLKEDGTNNAFTRRYKGYLWALEHYGIPFDEKLVFEKSGDHFQSGYQQAKEMYRKYGASELPTAVFVANDAMAIGAIHFFKKKGIRIPDDLSIVGFNNNFFADYCEPGLTTVNFPIYEAGKKAASYIIDEIQGLRREPFQEVLSCELVIRETTKNLEK
jgi:DNA-binding LacI/PurR family transcriptional regulator